MDNGWFMVILLAIINHPLSWEMVHGWNMMVIINYHYQPLSIMMTGMMDNPYDWDMNGITNYNDL